MAETKPGFFDYLKSAFNLKVKVKALGDIPLNWLALVGLAAISIPTGWFFLLFIGAGAEIAYLYSLSSSVRFQKYVDGLALLKLKGSWEDKKNAILEKLDPEDKTGFFNLENKCGKIKKLAENFPVEDTSGSIKQSYEGLEQLLWVALRLFLTRKIIKEFVKNETPANLQRKVKILEDRMAVETSERAKKSCQSTLEILKKRLDNLSIADEKLKTTDLEIIRIGEQLDLLINEAALSKDPASISEKIDVIASGLGETAEWIKTSSSVFGPIEDQVAGAPIGLMDNLNPQAEKKSGSG